MNKNCFYICSKLILNSVSIFNFALHIFIAIPLHIRLKNSTIKNIFDCLLFLFQKFISLRKVKMDQRKLMDNANTITDMAKTQNTVYEIVSDMATRQDSMEERITRLEEKIQHIQVCGKTEKGLKFIKLTWSHWCLTGESITQRFFL